MACHNTADLAFKHPSFYLVTTSEPTNSGSTTTDQREVADSFFEAKGWKIPTLLRKEKYLLHAELTKIYNKNSPNCETCRSYPKSVCKVLRHSPGFIPSLRHHKNNAVEQCSSDRGYIQSYYYSMLSKPFHSIINCS